MGGKIQAGGKSGHSVRLGSALGRRGLSGAGRKNEETGGEEGDRDGAPETFEKGGGSEQFVHL